MNTHVFNSTAEELRTSIYGYNTDTEQLQQIRLSADGELLVSAEGMEVLVSGNSFVTNTESITTTDPDETGILLANTNISALRTATMFVFNDGIGTVTVTLQISPDGLRYIDDPNHTPIVVEPDSGETIVLSTFARFAQLVYSVAEEMTTVTAFVNGQA